MKSYANGIATSDWEKEYLSKFLPAKFLVCRAPLLSFDLFDRWSKEIPIHLPYADRVKILRDRLQTIISLPGVDEALTIASPSLVASIPTWLRKPDSKNGIQTQRSLARYFSRMSSRATPFGTFSGICMGEFSQSEDLESFEISVPGREAARVAIRLDYEYLLSYTAQVNRDVDIRKALHFNINPTLYTRESSCFYEELRWGQNGPSRHLVKAQIDQALAEIISIASTPRLLEDIGDRLCTRLYDPVPTKDDIVEYIEELVNANILVSELFPRITGADPLQQLRSVLAKSCISNEQVDKLQRIAFLIDEIQIASSTSTSLASIHELDRVLAESLPISSPSHRYQADLIFNSSTVVIPSMMMDDLLHIQLQMQAILPDDQGNDLEVFRNSFREKYEDRWVPLVDLFDSDGIGFGGYQVPPATFLARGVSEGVGSPLGGAALTRFHYELLLQLYSWLLSGSQNVLELNLAKFTKRNGPPVLPKSFSLLVSILSASQEAVKKGSYSILHRGGFSPSGMQILGRFTAAIPGLKEGVEEHLSMEESLNPNAVFAEIALFPNGRIGNILYRPKLRQFEITNDANSSFVDGVISINDLWVSVDGTRRITLYSRSLKREVIPRLTSAHHYKNPNLPAMYRFLATLQDAGEDGIRTFNWGPLSQFERLPRVTCGCIVLCPAVWSLNERTITELSSPGGSESFERVQKLRRQRNLPRLVSYVEGDLVLPVDLDNEISVDALLHVLSRATSATLLETLPLPSELCANGNSGRLAHELVVPFTCHDSVIRDQKPINFNMTPITSRTKPPGSEWVYLKLYAGTDSIEDLLIELANNLQSVGTDNVFFVRYADPNPHLRIRVKLNSTHTQGVTESVLLKLFQPYLDAGTVNRMVLDTYERECERYGGEQGMNLVEDLFFQDSLFVLSILSHLTEDEGEQKRWRVAAMSVIEILNDAAIPVIDRPRLMGLAREAFGRDTLSPANKQVVIKKLREVKKEVMSMAARAVPSSFPKIEWLRPFLDRRSRFSQNVWSELHAASAKWAGARSFDDIVISVIHMHLNRIFRERPNVQEGVLYNIVEQSYNSILAVQKQQERVF